MNLLQDIITYVRRIVKTPSNSVLSDNLIIDYINRFWLMDVDARVQLFDLKSTYRFQTTPGVDQYNMPLYSVQTQPGNQNIGMFPVYQGFLSPAYVAGVQVGFFTQKQQFFGNYPKVVQQNMTVAVGDGTTGPYTINIPMIGGETTLPQNPPFNGILRGHVDMTGIIALGNNVDAPIVDSATASGPTGTIARVPVTSVQSAVYLTYQDETGASVVVQDSGQFLDGNVNYGLFMNPGKSPNGNTWLGNGYSTTSNTINYFTGQATMMFDIPVPAGVNINAQCYFFQTGLPRSILFFNNTITLRSPPDQQYLVELDAYLTPAAFLNTQSTIPFGYMAEYIARGAARKLLSDTGDVEQFNFYEPLFREQEMLVWKRAQRQFTSTRTPTIYMQSTDNQTNAPTGGLTGGY